MAPGKMDKELDMSQQCVFAAQATPILSCIQSSMVSRSRDLPSAPVKLRLQCCVQLWSLLHGKDMDLLEWVHKK